MGGLKFGGNGAVIISGVNGWLSSRQEDEGRDAWVGVIVMAMWKWSYCSWHYLRSLGKSD